MTMINNTLLNNSTNDYNSATITLRLGIVKD